MIQIKPDTGTYRVKDKSGNAIGRIELYDKYCFEPFAGCIEESEALAIWTALRMLNEGKQLKAGAIKGPGLAKALSLE